MEKIFKSVTERFCIRTTKCMANPKWDLELLTGGINCFKLSVWPLSKIIITFKEDAPI